MKNKMKNNRQIKFRVWNGKFKEMIYPPESFRWTLSLDGEIFRGVGTSIKEKEKCVLLQFTGLLDKNNEEIYEGDIIKVKNDELRGIGEVIYSFGSFVIINKCGALFPDSYFSLTSGEVVGNIFENPELF